MHFQAFYRHLTAWVCHGTLLEAHPLRSDFFIADHGPAPDTPAPGPAAEAENLHRFHVLAEGAPAELAARPEVLETTLFLGTSVRLMLNFAAAPGTPRPLTSADALRYEEICSK